jgi:hypothetical protein
MEFCLQELKHFHPTLIDYYENTILKYVSKDEKDSKRYLDCIILYQAIKEQES